MAQPRWKQSEAASTPDLEDKPESDKVAKVGSRVESGGEESGVFLVVQVSNSGWLWWCGRREKRATRDALGQPVALTGALSRAGFNGGCGLRKLFAWSSEGCVDGGGAAGSAVVCVPWCRRVGRGDQELVMLQPPPGFASVSISDSGRVRHGNWLFWRDKYSNGSQVDSSVEN